MSITMPTIRELVAQLASNDQVQVFQARRKLNDEIDRLSNPRKTAQLSALADELVAELVATADQSESKPRMTNVPDDVSVAPTPKHSAGVRRVLCQLLSPIASDAQVPALATALADLEVREMVRCVLGQIPSLVATKQLVRASLEVGPEFRVGVLNSLAQQGWREAMTTLMRGAKDPDLEIRLTALEGLAHFPEADNDKLFVEATKLDSPRYSARAQKARVRLAETLRFAGEAEAATAIYQSIDSTAPDGPWKKAARIALAALKHQP
jgi:HEAT repeat protein